MLTHFQNFHLCHILIIYSFALFSMRRGTRRALLLLKWMSRWLIFILQANLKMFILGDISTGPPHVQMRGMRAALVCPKETSDVEVNCISEGSIAHGYLC